MRFNIAGPNLVLLSLCTLILTTTASSVDTTNSSDTDTLTTATAKNYCSGHKEACKLADPVVEKFRVWSQRLLRCSHSYPPGMPIMCYGKWRGWITLCAFPAHGATINATAMWGLLSEMAYQGCQKCGSAPFYSGGDVKLGALTIDYVEGNAERCGIEYHEIENPPIGYDGLCAWEYWLC